MRNTTTQNKTNKGFTLIEALITLLILSIGLLGLAGLQNKGLQFNQVAYQRSQAAMIAYDIVDRMRANTLEAQANGYDVAHGTTLTAGLDCSTAPCTQVNMAAYDLFKWKEQLETNLPAGGGEITSAAAANVGAPAVDLTITVRWDELRKGLTTPGMNCPPLNDNDLKCFQLVVTM